MQDEWTPEDVLKVAGKAHLLPMLPASMYNIAKVGLSRSRTHTILDPCAMMHCSSAVKSVNSSCHDPGVSKRMFITFTFLASGNGTAHFGMPHCSREHTSICQKYFKSTKEGFFFVALYSLPYQ